MATAVQTDKDKKAVAASLQQIPVGGVVAPATDGSQGSTEFGRNVNNSLNALGGMGVMASVPLGVAKSAMSAAPQLASPIAKLGMSGGANFVAGVGPSSLVASAPAAKAIPYLPAVNVALQEGAQANALAAATRTTANAGAAVTALDGTGQPLSQQQAAKRASAGQPQSEYARQMSAVGNALVEGPMAALKTIVSAPGYGFNQNSRPAAPIAPTAQAPTAQAPSMRDGGGSGLRMDATQDPRSTLARSPAMADQTGAVPAEPVNPNQITATRQPNGVMSFSGGPNIGQNGGAISYTGAAGFKPSGAGVTSVPASSLGSASSASDAAVSAARAAAADRGDFKAVSDSYGGNFAGGQYGAPAGMQTATQRLQQQTGGRTLNANGARALLEAQNSDAASTAQRSATDVANKRLGIDQQEANTKTQESGFRVRSAARLEAAQAAFRSAKTPDEKSAAEQNLRAEQGKYEKEVPDVFSTTPIPFKTDPVTGEVSGGGAIVTDRRTGNVRIISASEMKSPPAPLPAGMTKQIGTQNGKPVYEDKSGKQFIGN